MVRVLLRVGTPLMRLAHRPVLTGAENLPERGPYLLVANHSGGFAVSEVISFAVLYLQRFGASRRLAGFAHPFAFQLWPLSALLRALGAIPSSRGYGEGALAEGVPLLIFPGGDHEGFRPIWQARRVDFGGRMGFLRLAQRARVPIVPMGIRGSHFTLPVLWRSKLLPYLLVTPRLVGIKRWPLTLVGVVGAAVILALAPWAWPWKLLAVWGWLGFNPVLTVPWIPWPIRFRIGAPIAPEELFGEPGSPASPASEADLKVALDRVQGEVQALHDTA